MKRFALFVTFISALLVATASQAVRYTVNLSGPNENPVNASPGIGAGTVDIDPATHQLAVNVVFNSLTGTTTASHIHCCITVPGGTAGVATTTPTFAGFPLGVTSGTFSTNLDMTQTSTWNPAFVTANGSTNAGAEAALVAGAAAGTAYLNIHSSAFPGGEIRGFLILQPPGTATVPTLSQWALMALAGLVMLAGILYMRKRQR